MLPVEPRVGPTPRDRRSLPQRVFDSLSAQILAGVYKAGDKLPCEKDIMLEHGVSRAVIREAISRLQSRDMVQTRHGVGSFISMPAEGTHPVAAKALAGDMLKLIEVRISVETETAALAAQRALPHQLEKGARILERLADPATPRDIAAKLDYEFHHLIAQATGNRYFVEFVEYLEQTLIPRTRVNTSALAQMSHGAYNAVIGAEHQSIFDAIARRDASAAKSAMRLHLINVRERFNTLQC